MTLRSDYEVEHYLDHQAEIFLARFDPLTYLYMSRVMDYFDPFAEDVPAPAGHALPGHLLQLATGASARRTRGTSRPSCAARGVDVRREEVASPWGHDSFLMDVPEYHALVREFIAWVSGAPPARSVWRAPQLSSTSSTPAACPPPAGPGSPSHLPAGTPVRVQELETINAYWADDPKLTVDAIADRLHAALRPAARGCSWAGASAASSPRRSPPARRSARGASSCSTRSPRASATSEPAEAELLRSFAMYRGARRGRTLSVDPARLARRPRATRSRTSSTRPSPPAPCARDTPPATVRRCYDDHARRVLRDYRLTARHTPSGLPLTVVKAAGSLAPESRALGWDRFGPVEVLASAGDHYTMLTDRRRGAPPGHAAPALAGPGLRRR